MSMSRSESRRHDKQKRKRRMRRLLAVNLTLLAAIIILISVIVATTKQHSVGSGEERIADQRNETHGNSPGGAIEPADPPGQADDAGRSGGNSGSVGDNSSDAGNSGSVGSESGSPDSSGSAGSGGSGGSSSAGDEPPASGGNAQSPSDAAEDGLPNESGAPGTAPDDGGSGSGQGGGSVPGRNSGGMPKGETVRLAFVGDIMMGSSVEKLMRQKGLEYPFEGALSYLQGPDLTAGNLENPITKRGVPAQNKSFVFKGSPDLLPPLKQAGFDVVTLANNHTLDQGTEGLFDTMKYLDEAGIPHVGGGHNDTEAFAPEYLETKGVKVAYIGVSRVVPETSWKADKYRPGVAETYDSTRAVAAIKEARKRADLVVVMVHWGVERQDYPVQHQKTLAHTFVDAGADLVIGSHPHVMQGFEYYKNKWIAYSLGNFIFNNTSNVKTKQTGVLDAVCSKDGQCGLQLHPMFADKSKPVPMNAEDGAALLARLSKLSINAAFDRDGVLASR
ncbi:CapA family protein [Paenibacillus beijingensis]|uniref:Capsule synthesis protein CapA domain-containing protein n=1 Tax=Paenibacillus beijingensis TaxID=1126833 RepID=A0A0D5NEJ2_9BACL|nr:CapA family protein [Paenibacillus beijingensis]AJY73392.1 hypothetical protein VN24_00550 [Paenibacillus beijingensis]